MSAISSIWNTLTFKFPTKLWPRSFTLSGWVLPAIHISTSVFTICGRTSLKERLGAVETPLAGTKFGWSAETSHTAVTCPWGNRFRCFAPDPRFGDMALGIPYIEFLVERGRAAGIARFYDRALGAPTMTDSSDGGISARVKIGRNQSLVFRETEEPCGSYDGHHIAIYVSNFSRPYAFLKDRGLISEQVRNHQ